jgi:hypothetical protein
MVHRLHVGGDMDIQLNWAQLSSFFVDFVSVIIVHFVSTLMKSFEETLLAERWT